MDDLLASAIAAARLARGIHLYYQEKGFAVDTKTGPTDLVTQADREAEAAVKAFLLERYPDHAFLGEEGGQDHEAAYRWIVDPLDGTVNFAHRFPFFAVSIGLEVRGRLELGVVLDSTRDELFWAVRGRGAYLNGRPLRVSATDRLIGSLLATGFPYDVSKDRENLVYFERALEHGLTVRRPGAAALDLCYVAAGRLDGFWEVKLKPWDVAAAVVIVEEAGGRVTGLAGEPYALGNRYIVASNGRIHAEMIEALFTEASG
ncbi:inositol monophosphatase [Oceanithermus profundus DSM 14977]|uniref:Inositol-1-monophosphatase n=1 Tax=Oceanithermus profundus (strain DSM 14977 / NBRC 100410 / VKM B-2274 / 506) TaxID=670487 RepID=E4U4E8_OCEP5|nr:inositol monophosphatase family protein [Oceanithermus profundus]ADR36351.1 inositol monophosphatase [Oceanithermus profundus DSM 14977]